MSKEIDYLTEDPILSEQKYMCVSFLKPSNIEESKRPKDITVCGFKFRGAYSTYEEAKTRADFLQKCDPYHNIYIGEVGKWCPFEDNPDKAKDSEYMNKDLNKLMKSYWQQQNEAKEFHELRKQDMIKKALEEANKKKEDNENNPEVKKKTKKNKDENKLDEMKNEIKIQTEELEREKKEKEESINRLRKLEEELALRMKEMELENAKKLVEQK